MPDRRVSVTVSVRGGGEVSRELDSMAAEAAAASAALRSIPNHVDVHARSTGLNTIEADARKAQRSTSALVDSVAMLWPTLAPIGASTAPLLAGLTMQFGAVAGAVGTTILALHGVGDALKALDAYQLEPTAANLAKVNEEMSKLSPSAQAFVHQLDHLEPQLKSLQTAAADGLLPGVSEGLDRVVKQLPLVRQIFAQIGSATGDLAADIGAGLNDREWTDFLNMVRSQAKPILSDFGHTVGDLATGIADLMVATVPLSTSFSSGLAKSAHSFREWADTVDETQGFQDFLAYAQKTGPQVVHTLGALSEAFLHVIEAGAPLGGPILSALTALANVVTRIADSPLGSPLVGLVSGVAALNRVLAINATMKDSLVAQMFRGQGQVVGGVRSATAGVTGFAAAWRGVAPAVLDANAALKIAQEREVAALAAARDAQFALIPRGDKVAAINTWTKAKQETALASERVAAAEAAQAATVRGGLATMGKSAVAIGAVALATSDLGEKLHVSHAAMGAMLGLMAGPEGAALGAFAGGLWDIVDGFDLLGRKAGAEAARQEVANKAMVASDARADAAIRDGLAQGLLTTAHGAETAADSVADFTRQVDILEGHISRQADMDAFRKSLLDFDDALKQNGRTLDKNTPKGLANRAALRDIATTALQAAQDLKGLDKLKFLDKARQDLVRAATQADMTKAAAHSLANEWLGLNNLTARPKIKIDIPNVLTQISFVKAQLAALTHPRTVEIQIHRTNKNTFGGTDTLSGLVPKGGYASGGYTGNYPAHQPVGVVHGGEFVFDALSTQRAGVDRLYELQRSLRGYAEGGHVGLRPGDQSTGPNKKKPLFTHEGPRYYHAAYKHNRPFALAGPSHWDWPYQTGLGSRKNANEFAEWVRKKHVPFDLSARIVDYDMRGYWKKTKGRGWHRGSHFPDTFKTPYDTTFSHESKYATRDNPFYWHGDKLVDTRNGQVIFAADGGYMMGPGGPRDDLIPAWLSNGEFVVNAATTARLRPWLEYENARGYADGGTAKKKHKNPFPASDRSAAAHAFDLTAGMSIKSLENEFWQLAHTVKTHRGHLGADFGALEKRAKALDLRWGKVNDALDKQKGILDDLRSQRDSLKSTVADSLTSNPFATPSNVWAKSTGAGGIFSSLKADITNAGQFDKLAAQLKKNGVHGQALAYAESQGLGALQQLAGLNPAQQKQYQQLFHERSLAVKSAQATAAATYGPLIRAQAAHVKELRGDLRTIAKKVEKVEKAVEQGAHVTGDKVTKGMNKSASAGWRRGNG